MNIKKITRNFIDLFSKLERADKSKKLTVASWFKIIEN